MKLKSLLITSLILLNTGMSANAEKKIAVLPFDVPDEKAEMKQFGVGTMDTITFALNGIKDIIMIDRSQLQAVMKEIAFQKSGLVETNDAVKVGKLLGAEVLVIGSIQKYDNKFRIIARFTEVQTGKILGVSQVTGTDIFELQDQLAKDILNNQKITLTEIQKKEISNITKATSSLQAYDYYTKGKNSYLLLSRKGYEEAIENFDKALELDPNYNLALFAKLKTQALWAIDLQQTQEDYNKLLNDIENSLTTLLKTDSNTSEAYIALSMVYMVQKRIKESGEAAKKALAINPNSPEALFLAWRSTGDKNGNSRSLDPEHPYIKKAIQLNPYLILSRTVRAYAYIAHKKPKEAEEELKVIMKSNPDSYFPHTAMFLLKIMDKDIEGAINELKEAKRLSPETQNIRISLADFYFGLGRYDEAFSEYNEALKLKPNNVINIGLGRVYYAKNDYQAATEQYNKVLNNKPEKKDKLNADLGIALIAKETGKLDESTQLFNNMLKDKDQYLLNNSDESIDTINGYKNIYSRIYINLAEINKSKGNINDSINNYNQAIELNDSQKAKRELAAIMSEIGLKNYSEGKVDEAISYLNKSLSLLPEDDNTYNNLGVMYYAKNKLETAMEQYQKAIKYNPKNANAWNNIGMIYEKKGKSQEAMNSYKKSCELGMKSSCELVK